METPTVRVEEEEGTMDPGETGGRETETSMMVVEVEVAEVGEETSVSMVEEGRRVQPSTPTMVTMVMASMVEEDIKAKDPEKVEDSCLATKTRAGGDSLDLEGGGEMRTGTLTASEDGEELVDPPQPTFSPSSRTSTAPWLPAGLSGRAWWRTTERRRRSRS